MTIPLHVLILEDSADDAELLAAELTTAGFDPTWSRVDDAAGLLAGLAGQPDIVIADYHLPRFDALAALTVVRNRAPEVPVIVVSGAMSEEACVQALRLGAVDYLLKDRLGRLGPAVRHALARRRLEAAHLKAERAAQDAATLLQDLVDGAPAMIYLTDEEGRFLLVNSEFERAFGIGRDELIGRTAAEVPIGQPRDLFAERNVHCLEEQAVLEAEEVLSTEDREYTYLSIRYPVSRAGGARSVAGIYTDIGRQKQIERALRIAEVDLRRQARELANANVDLEKLNLLQNQFVATVSHELRTPLTSIRGYAEILADDERLGSAERRMVEIIDRNSLRLLDLIEDLLTFARVDSDDKPLDLVPVDVAELVERCRTAVEPAAAAAGLTLRCEVADAIPAVTGDRRQLERVLLNLLSNAVKFSPGGGTVTVTAGYDSGGTVSLAVSDAGLGIPLDEQAQVFTRFFRSSVAEEHAIGGTGLGLSICKAIVDRHGGHIALTSTPGAGTTLTVTLAAVEDDPEAAADVEDYPAEIAC